MLRKQVEEMGQLNQGLLKEKEEFLRREQEGQKEKRGIFESHSKDSVPNSLVFIRATRIYEHLRKNTRILLVFL